MKQLWREQEHELLPVPSCFHPDFPEKINAIPLAPLIATSTAPLLGRRGRARGKLRAITGPLLRTEKKRPSASRI